jgi:hypothetical protein
MLGSNLACGQECRFVADSYNQCINDQTGIDHVAVIERETQAAIDAYATWSGYPVALLKRLYRNLDVEVVIEAPCDDCRKQESFAFTRISPNTGSVLIKYDAWAVPWVFAESNGCWAATSLNHEAIHVLRFVDMVLLNDNKEGWLQEVKDVYGHTDEVFAKPNSPGVQARNEREKLCHM